MLKFLEKQASAPKDELQVKLNTLHDQYRLTAKQARVVLPNKPGDRSEPDRPKINVHYLQAVMTEALEDFGGVAHPSTLALYAQRRWLNKETEDPNDEYDFQDFRRAVKMELKRNPESFERVSGAGGQFMEWQLTAAERLQRQKAFSKWQSLGFSDRRPQIVSRSMPDLLRGLLLDKPSGVTQKQLELEVTSVWKRTGSFDSVELMKMTLETNPAFHDHDRDSALWELTPEAKPEARRFLGRSSNLGASPVATASVVPPTSSSDFKRPERGRRGRSPSRESPAKASTRNKRKKEQSTENSSWCQCDSCGAWVSSATDERLVDLSLYDDRNPNHLDYHCPVCREEEERQSKRQASRPKRLTQDLTNALDAMDQELTQAYRSSRAYWKKASPNLSGGAQVEENFVRSVQTFKQSLMKSEDDVLVAKRLFKSFFSEQLTQLKDAIKELRANK